jgi:hypothetical protein
LGPNAAERSGCGGGLWRVGGALHPCLLAERRAYSSVGATTDTIDVSALPDGLYRIRATADNGAGDSSTSPYYYFLQGETGAPPVVTGVTLNGDAGTSVSSIEPSGVGVQTIEIAFSEAMNFTSGDVTVQEVTFPGGTETVGDALTPTSITGSGTTTMTIAFDIASVLDTWVKVTLDGGTTITDLAGIALDGEAASDGSGRGYIYDGATDLPTGDGTAGGDAVFYVGSLQGDLHGGSFSDAEPNGVLTFLDVLAFNEAYETGNLDADFHGGSFGDTTPDGALTFLDVLAFNDIYQAAASLDVLPMSLSSAALLLPDESRITTSVLDDPLDTETMLTQESLEVPVQRGRPGKGIEINRGARRRGRGR